MTLVALVTSFHKVRVMLDFCSTATQQAEGEGEAAGTPEVVVTTAAADVVTTTQGRAITTVTQSTPAPGPSVPVRKSIITAVLLACGVGLNNEHALRLPGVSVTFVDKRFSPPPPPCQISVGVLVCS